MAWFTDPRIERSRSSRDPMSEHFESSETLAHDVERLIHTRRSEVGFEPRAVDHDTLVRLLDAARWAPSSRNEQPWHFVVAPRDESESFTRLLSTLTPANAAWAGRAGALMLSVARTTLESRGNANRHAFHDVGQAVANLSLMAVALGLAIHEMGGFDAARARELFSIPPEFEPVAAIAIGYPADPASLDEALRERATRPRTRRPIESFVHGARWDVLPGGFSRTPGA
jgi:nitroreductase